MAAAITVIVTIPEPEDPPTVRRTFVKEKFVHCNFSVRKTTPTDLQGSMTSPASGEPGGLLTGSGRITRSHKRNDIATFTETNKAPSFEFSGGGEGRGTNLDEVAWLIANLKETIMQQNNIIQSVKTNLAEIKTEQESLKNQTPNSKRRSDPSERNLEPTQRLSHQHDHGRGSCSRNATESSTGLSRTTNAEKLNKESNCLRISTQLNPDAADSNDTTFVIYLSIGSINNHIRSALLNANVSKIKTKNENSVLLKEALKPLYIHPHTMRRLCVGSAEDQQIRRPSHLVQVQSPISTALTIL